MEKYTSYVLVYLLAFSTILISTFSYNYTFSDEGTHFVLSVFYKDLITSLPSIGFSYTTIYNYGINYLVHYPKLQIAYPPVFHLTNLIPFAVFGPSVFLMRLVNLAYSISAFFLFFLLTKKYFGQQTAFVSTVFFSASTYSLLYASRAFQDFSAFFFILTSIWLFSKACESKETKYFLLCGIASAVSILSKQISAILVIFFFIHFGYKHRTKKGLKYFISFLIPLLIILTPYLALLKSVGGFEINRIVAVDYASQQGEPTNPMSPLYWLDFLVNPTFFAPFSIVFVCFLAFYIYKKEKLWKEFLVFFLVFYISLSAIPNKELRFSQLFLLPAYVAAASYLVKSKNKILLPSVLVLYILVSASLFYPTIQSYPQSEVADKIYKSLPAGASVSMFSDEEPLFSSALMSELLSMDKNKSLVIIRPCAFGNKTGEQITQILDESNTYFVVYSPWSQDKSIGKIANLLEPAFSVSGKNLTTEVYKYKNFQNKQPEKACNYICLTGEKICEK